MRLYDFIHHKALLYLGAFSKLIEVGLELFLPIFMGIMIDDGIKGNNSDITYQMLIYILVFSILGYLSTVFAHYLTSKVSQDYAHQLRLALFDKVTNLSFEGKLKFSPSSLLNRLNNDVLQTSNALAMTMRMATRGPLLMIGSIIALFFTARNISVVFAIVLPLIFIFVVIMVVMLLKYNQRLQKEFDESSLIVRENMDGILTVKAFTQDTFEKERYNKQNKVIIVLQRFLVNISSLGTPVVSLTLNLSLIFMIYLSAIEINIGNMSQGETLSMINYTTQLIIGMLAMFNVILLYARAFTSNDRIKEVLLLPSEDKVTGTRKLEKIDSIEFINVSYKYADQKSFLNGLSFKVNSLEKIGIVGLTGAGKSTVLRLAMSLIEPISGEIKINGFNIKEYNLYDLRNKMGYVDQKNMLLEGTIASNLKMGQEHTDQELLEALKLAQFPQKVAGLNLPVSKDGLNFSGGQRQRLCIARALVKRAPLLIIDDALASLDNKTEKALKRALKKLDYQPIIIASSSKLSSLSFTDKMMVLENGGIDDFGNHESLMQTSDLYRRLYKTQSELTEVDNV